MEKLMTKTDVCEVLQISPATLQKRSEQSGLGI